MAIGYLNGNEKPTGAQLNALYAEFERKLKRIFNGKSFILGGFGNGLNNGAGIPIPQAMMGKCFFFTSGPTVYSQLVPQFVTDGAGGARPYVHQLFVNEATLAGQQVQSYDEDNKVAKIKPRGNYGGAAPAGQLPFSLYVAFFEYSLDVHYVLHQGANDVAPVPYYFRESGFGGFPNFPPPSKRLRYGLADIIVEGPTSVALPYQKYDCYRVHNLNKFGIGVDLPDGGHIGILPFECKTIRRNPTGIGYNETGWNYFFPYRSADKYPDGDPRFFWFLPTAQIGATGVVTTGYAENSGVVRAANSMAANNLANPCILMEFLRHYEVDEAQIVAPTFYGRAQLDMPWIHRDPTVFYDCYPKYASLFGNPGDGGTIIGDLIHHRGDIDIIRKHKTLIDPATGRPKITRDKVTFRGYGTIISDFGAHKLKVVENANGQLVITNDDPDNDVDLVPVGTNLFKTGEKSAGDGPGRITLSTGSDGLPATVIENAIFETVEQPGGGWVMSDAGTRKIYQYQIVNQSNTQQWAKGDLNAPQQYTVETATGPNIQLVNRVNDDNPATPSVDESLTTMKHLVGIHKTRVSDIVALAYWGNGALTSQNSNTISYNTSLKLTMEGLLLNVTVAINPILASDVNGHYPMETTLSRTLQFKFRGHGWPYLSPTLGYMTAGGFSPRSGRMHINPVPYKQEVTGVSGEDFKVGPLGATETPIKQLHRITGPLTTSNIVDLAQVVNDPTANQTPATGKGSDLRFWQVIGIDSLYNYVTSAQTDTGYWLWAENHLSSNTHPAMMRLLPETYNWLASMVNAIDKGGCLSIWSVRLRINSTWMGLYNIMNLGSGFNYGQNSGSPVPLDFFASLSPFGPADQIAFLQALGIPVKGEGDFPGLASARAKDCVPLVVSVGGSASWLSGTGSAHDIGNGQSNITWDGGAAAISIGLLTLDARKLALGQNPGGPCAGFVAPGHSAPGIPFGVFYVVTDGSGVIEVNPSESQEGTSFSAFGGIAHGAAYYSGRQIDMIGAYTGVQWIGITDVKNSAAALGLGFIFEEVILQLDLIYLDPAQSMHLIQGISQTGFGLSVPAFGPYTFGTPDHPIEYLFTNVQSVVVRGTTEFNSIGVFTLSGCWQAVQKFYLNSGGQWKLKASAIVGEGGGLLETFRTKNITQSTTGPVLISFNCGGTAGAAPDLTGYSSDSGPTPGIFNFDVNATAGKPHQFSSPTGSGLRFEVRWVNAPGDMDDANQLGNFRDWVSIHLEYTSNLAPAASYLSVHKGYWVGQADYWESSAVNYWVCQFGGGGVGLPGCSPPAWLDSGEVKITNPTAGTTALRPAQPGNDVVRLTPLGIISLA